MATSGLELAAGFANGMLGQALGAHVDLGASDGDILVKCKELLSVIRSMQNDPDAMKRLRDLMSKARG